MLGLGLKAFVVVFVVVVVLPKSPSHAYGSKSTTSQPEEDQWSGVGGGTQVDPHHQGQNGHDNHNPGYNPEGGSQSQSYQSGNGKANHFARESHVERYGYPEGCVRLDPTVCNYFVEISKERDNPETLHFEVSGKVPRSGGYVAVGLSEDEYMGEDHIVECVLLADGSSRYYQSWSSGRKQPKRLPDNISVIKMDDSYPRYDHQKEILTCKFRRPIETLVDIEGQYRKFNLIQDKFHILLAKGNLAHSNSDVVGYHGDKQNGNVYASHEILGYSKEKYPLPSSDQRHDGSWHSSGSGHHSIRYGISLVFVSMLLPHYSG